MSRGPPVRRDLQGSLREFNAQRSINRGGLHSDLLNQFHHQTGKLPRNSWFGGEFDSHKLG